MEANEQRAYRETCSRAAKQMTEYGSISYEDMRIILRLPDPESLGIYVHHIAVTFRAIESTWDNMKKLIGP